MVPCIFEGLYDSWVFGKHIEEVQRCWSIFPVSLALIFVEMVLAVSRPRHRGRCWILVLASCYSVFQNLEVLVPMHCASIASHVHTVFGFTLLSHSDAAYDAIDWIDFQRM